MATENDLFFLAGGNEDGWSLWRSDGSAEGSSVVDFIGASSLTPYAGALYFTGGLGLYRSDGTEKGTLPVLTTEGYPLRQATYLRVAGDHLYFRALDHQDQHWIWAMDGAGVPRKLLRVVDGESLMHVGSIGNRALFGADDSHGHDLWISDGTAEGTHTLARHGYPSDFAELNGKTYYAGWTAFGRELMVTDGTTGGTKLAIDLEPSTGSSFPEHLTIFRNRLYFQASSRRGIGLWSTDGTEAGTRFESSGRGRILVLGSLLYFATDTELRRTDGFSVSRFRDVDFGDLLSAAGGRIWFEEHYQNRPCETEPSCTALWASDGTTAGTVRMEGLVRYGGAFPIGFKNDVCFPAVAPSTGAALWCVSGTSNQPRLIKKFTNREWFRSSSPQLFPTQYGPLYLSAFTSETGRELWVSDLSESGTIMLKDLNPGVLDGVGGPVLETSNGRSVFVGLTEVTGAELWVTEGTPQTTRALIELRPGPEHGAGELLFAIAGRAYFLEAPRADEAAWMWSTDGTEAGTRRELFPAPQSPSVWGSKIVFVGNRERDACTVCEWNPATGELQELWRPQEAHEYEPWFTRLEVAGNTLFVHTNGPGWGALYLLDAGKPSVRVSDSAVDQIVPVGSSLLLLSRATIAPLDRLWIRVYDESRVIYEQWVEAEQGVGYSVVAGDRVFIFVGRDGGSSRDLWVFDDEGLRHVERFANWTGEVAGTPDGLIFFNYAQRGDREMWQSDGTPAGTRRAWDINPAGSSNPTQLRVIGSHLVFVADLRKMTWSRGWSDTNQTRGSARCGDEGSSDDRGVQESDSDFIHPVKLG